ncbi:MAG: metallophosphoesterase family protein [Chitinophagales bacterium]|nr:metallophosphoesterase family protein [Chitinophagales bacterium]
MTKELGHLKGPILVFGGVYSNLQALEALRQIAEELNIPPANIICTGDVVAYCAQPEESVRSIREWNIHCIAGNVELQIASGASDCACDFVKGGRCDSFSKEWYPYTQQNLSTHSIEWMKQLPEFLSFHYAEKKALVLHGAHDYTSEFIFESTAWSIKHKNFKKTQADIILAGHCGLPFSQEQEGKYWLNAGVIGMPANDGTPRVWYMILNDKDENFQFEHRALDYNYQQASELMLKQQLTPAYAKTLYTGIWDNCEILPPSEEKRQGEALNFS